MSNKTALFSNAQPGGVYVIADAPEHPGNIWFVDSGHDNKADSAGAGGSPDRPLATIDYAIGLCTASNGDVIYVAPGHSETLTAAITCDVAGVKIVGLGEGALRPQLTVAANGIDGITVTADNVTIENLYFNEATVASAAANINIAADSCTVRRVHMDMGANDRDGFTITAAGERPTIEDCTAKVTANGPDTWITFEGVIDRPIVRRNIIIASDGTDPFDDHILDFGGLAITNPVVIDNVFDGADQAVNSIDDAGSCVGDCFSGNKSAGSAVDGDTVSTVTATIGAGDISAASFAADAIDAAAIAAGAIVAATFAAGAIDAAAIANGAIDAATLADDTLAAAKIATGAFTADAFAADAIVAATLATGALTADAFAADAIVAATLATDSITADALAADAVAEVADGAWDEALSGHLTAGTAGYALTSVERCVEKSDGAVILGDDALFTISGGPIHILEIAGIVTTEIGAGETQVKLQLDTTSPAGTYELNAGTVDIDADAVGTSYRVINTTGIFTPVTAGAVLMGNSFATNPTEYFAPAGTIQFNSAAARTGAIKWYMRYKPLSPNCVVTAAA